MALQDAISRFAMSGEQSDVDVLIIGAGPSGLMAAACLARYGVHNVRIIDKRGTQVLTGHADALNCRSLEIFQALGMRSRLVEEVNKTGEASRWNPDENGTIRRTTRNAVDIPGSSPYQMSTIHQGRIERLFLDKISQWTTPLESSSLLKESDLKIPQPRMKVERAVCPDVLTLPSVTASALSDLPEDRIIVRLRHLSVEEAQPAQFLPVAPDGIYRSNMFQDGLLDTNPVGLPEKAVIEEVRCRFIIGADGARSWTRKAIGSELVGDSANLFWGVLDGVPVTDFPDVRKLCTIHSAQKGSVLIVPREKDLVRMYIQLLHPEGKRPNRADITPENLLTSARSIFAPYTLEMPKIEWYTCYEIGQRLANHWVWNDRIFIAGDACHTHSPKAGQGMNISMADTFNLSWKIAHVLQRRANPNILKTYESERAPIAKELIEHDRLYSRMFSGQSTTNFTVSMEEFQRVTRQMVIFASGTAVDYPSGVLVSKPVVAQGQSCYNSKLASKLPIGRRLHSRQLVGVADAKVYQLEDLACADGRWKILIFGGDVTQYSSCQLHLEKLSKFLAEDPASPITKYTPKGADLDSVLNCLTILASPLSTIECEDFHEILRPKITEFGFRAYKKIFSDDESYHEGHGKVYENYGIDPQVGCLVVVRPDQHVSLVTDVTDHSGLASFFDSFMLMPANS